MKIRPVGAELLHADGQSNGRTERNNEVNPLNAQLNPIYHMLALLGAHHILHVSTIELNPI